MSEAVSHPAATIAGAARTTSSTAQGACRDASAEVLPSGPRSMVADTDQNTVLHADGIPRVALLTGGGDKPYATALACALSAAAVPIDFVGSDELDTPEVRGLPGVRFLNLRGDQRSDASARKKVARVIRYYARLIRYATTARPRIFHVLWNNKFEYVDRTVLMLYYRLLGKRLVLTVHNVNAGQRDGRDSALNRLTLRMQYALADHVFVHTDAMRRQLQEEFGVARERITTVPFGINSTAPTTALDRQQARQELRLPDSAPVILFFGNIAPYKGLEYAVEAMAILGRTRPEARLIVAGRPKTSDAYWPKIAHTIRHAGLEQRILLHTTYIPDEQVEVFFKAADVLILPYTHVFQSGVLFLGYHFGLPAIVSDVGELEQAVIEGVTGFVCVPADAEALANALDRYFRSALYEQLERHRPEIRRLMSERHSWDHVGRATCGVYRELTAREPLDRPGSRTASR